MRDNIGRNEYGELACMEDNTAKNKTCDYAIYLCDNCECLFKVIDNVCINADLNEKYMKYVEGDFNDKN